ncbi:hypothetical protein CCUS01_09704 [Colletotrichum cuscutae]|uniref:Uncharacterized protein n=1 Tax=Colletotrichum cuscutae TaxID=1209917 RepID=A0AAI9UFW6_9PEZI|nr:hypothetical protein CCUS01_09704 [Colletotrichum cuscutae]
MAGGGVALFGITSATASSKGLERYRSLAVLGHTYPACPRTTLCRPHRYYTAASDCTIGQPCPKCLSKRLPAEAFIEEQVSLALLAKKQLCTPSHPDIQLIVSAELQTVHKQVLNGNEWCQNRAPDPEAGISSQDRTTRGYSLAGGGRTRPMQLAGNDAPCCPIRSANSQTNVQ